MAASDIEAMIVAAIPDARVEIRDLAGDGDHFAARVVSATYKLSHAGDAITAMANREAIGKLVVTLD